MKKIFIGYLRKCDVLTMFGTTIAFIGMYLCSTNHYTTAVFLLLICGICDGFDGALARKYKYSEEQKVYGAELDSLSDCICFGLFPAFLTISINSNILCIIISVLFMLCGLVRLAYFNMLSITKTGKKKTFIGFPITTSAIIYPLVFLCVRLINFSYLKIVMPIMLVILGTMFILRIELPKPDVPKIISRIFNKYVVTFLVLPAILIFSSDIFYRTNLIGNPVTMTLKSGFANINSYILIFILVLSIVGIILGLTKTSKRTKIVLFIFITVLLLINDIKLSILNKPLMVSDISFLNPDNMSMMGKTVLTIGPWIFAILLKTLVLSLIFFILVKLDKLHHLEVANIKKRVILGTVSLLVFITLVIPIESKNDALTKIFFNNYEESSFTVATESFNNYGFIGGMYFDLIRNVFMEPLGYKEFDVEVLKSNLGKNESSWPKANVVFLLSESFFDLDNITDISFDKNLTPNIDYYIEEDVIKSFDLLVPAYGGASVNTEFEILTGFPLAFTKLGYIPFNDYYMTSLSFKTPNLIQEFNNNNYKTIYLTPWGENSYNSKNVYQSLGTDELIYNVNTGENKGYYYSDDSLIDDIYAALQLASEEEPVFIMSATSQNHFPYEVWKYNDYDIEIESTNINQNASEMLKSYAQGIFDTDKAIKKLYEYIKSLDTNTIVVIYGDHLPSIIDDKKNNVLLDSKYLKNDPYSIKTYTTKGYIMANFNLGDIEISYLNSNYLGSYVLNNMDLKVSDYFKIIDEFRRNIPAFNNFVYYDKESKSFVSQEMLNKNNYTLNDYKNLEYKYFFDGVTR